MPSVTIHIATSADDARVSTDPTASYPPSTLSAVATDGDIWNVKQFTGGFYRTSMTFLRFDTSVIPDGARITSAVLRMRIGGGILDADNRNMNFEWYGWTAPITTSDFIETAGTTAGVVDITSGLIPLATGNVEDVLSLTNPDANINRTGYTGIRFGISSGVPTGINEVYVRAIDNATSHEAQLVVTYDIVNTFEGGTDGTVITTGNSGGTSGAAFNVVATNTAGNRPAFDDSPVFDGVFAMRITTADTANCYVRWTGLSSSDAYGSLCVYFASNPATKVTVGDLLDVGAATRLGRIRVNTTGKVEVGDTGNNTLATTTASIKLNAWTRIDWRYQVAPNTLTVRLAPSPRATYVEEISGAMTTASALDTLSLGQPIGLGAVDFWMDNLIAGSSSWFVPGGDVSLPTTAALSGVSQ